MLFVGWFSFLPAIIVRLFPGGLDCFDSDEERQFISWLLTVLREESLSWSIIPQIYLASICQNFEPEQQERGDFYWCIPNVSLFWSKLTGLNTFLTNL